MTFTVYGLSGPEHWPLEKVFKEREPQPIAAIEKTRFIEKQSSQIGVLGIFRPKKTIRF